ncbi:MAG TPA: hypothetical protein VFN61_01880, partial [Acidimicrobiales bacterium]|nr:hypothetical protein [Acidimicrobiales bacterium]
MDSLVTGNRLRHRGWRQREAPGRPLTRRRAWSVPAVGGAALLMASGVVHLYLYFNGYGPVPTIGDLFLSQFAACTLVGAAIVTTRGFVAPAAGALLAMATLSGYLLSLMVKLFGFREVPTSYGAAAGGLEIGAFAVLASVSLARFLTGAAAAKRALTGTRRAGLVGVPSLVIAATLALSLELLLVNPVAGAGTGAATSNSGAATVVAVRLAPYGTVLATPGHMPLYLLSDEKPGHTTCNAGCLSIWPPLLLAAHQRGPQAGAGIRGT